MSRFIVGWSRALGTINLSLVTVDPTLPITSNARSTLVALMALHCLRPKLKLLPCIDPLNFAGGLASWALPTTNGNIDPIKAPAATPIAGINHSFAQPLFLSSIPNVPGQLLLAFSATQIFPVIVLEMVAIMILACERALGSTAFFVVAQEKILLIEAGVDIFVMAYKICRPLTRIVLLLATPREHAWKRLLVVMSMAIVSPLPLQIIDQ